MTENKAELQFGAEKIHIDPDLKKLKIRNTFKSIYIQI